MDARSTFATSFELGAEETLTDAQALPDSLTVERVYHDYAPRVFSVARSMVSSDMDAEDVMQDVLLQVVRKLPTFRGDAAFPTWLHRVTVNTALSHRRRQAVRQEHGLDRSLEACTATESTTPASRNTPPPAEQLEGHETRAILDQAIAALPEMYREVFVLSEVDGTPNSEIAERLGMSLPAVKSRLHRARAMLRESLAPHFDPIGV